MDTSSIKTLRKGRDHYSHEKADARKALRRRQAEDRQFKYDGLTLKQKLATCIPGGSLKQRARLEALIAAEKAPSSKTPPLTEAQKADKAVKRAKASATHAAQ